jgi:fructokinase
MDGLPGAFGGIEAGGTKFRCLIANGPGDILARASIPTTSPTETMTRVSAFFAKQRPTYQLLGIGVASFGPVDLNHASPTYGHLLGTPKSRWQHFDLLDAVVTATGCEKPALDTDVNAAALAEYVWGASPDVDPLVYLTVGTGIGGGGVVNGSLLHGVLHPEMGHMRVPREGVLDDFPGCCPLHGDCLEGLASGQALRERYSADPEHLPDDHVAWRLVTDYVALGVANIILTLAPKRVIVGGGVSRRLLWIRLYERLDAILQRYPIDYGDWANYIMSPRLQDDSGPLGAIALARVANGLALVAGVPASFEVRPRSQLRRPSRRAIRGRRPRP